MNEEFFTLRDIARACQANKRTVARLAQAEQWPSQIGWQQIPLSTACAHRGHHRGHPGP
jgi:hypothetical protein